MKRIRILGALVIAVLVSLSMLVPAVSVLAAEDVTIDPKVGAVGDTIEITGDDFDTAETGVDIYFSNQEADVDDDIDDEVDIYAKVEDDSIDATDPLNGLIDTSFKIPSVLDDGDSDEDVVSGGYFVYVTYDGDENIVAVASFTIRGITISPEQGNIFTEIEITGIGFTSSKTLTFLYDDVSVDISSGDTKTKSTGKFSTNIVVPESAAGEHVIKARVSSSVYATATFSIVPTMLAQPTTGKAGETGHVTGSGFAADSTVLVTIGGTDAGTGTSDDVGSFDIEFTVPDIAAGAVELSVQDDDGNSGSTSFTVEETIIPVINTTQPTSSSSPGYLGMDYTVSGIGFTPNATVTVTFASTPVVVATVTSDANGAFIATFKIPKTEPGTHTITATDGTNTLQIPFYMDSAAPAAPVLVTPAVGSSAEVQSVFDWADVSDPSGVTYSLQIATSPDFAAGTVLVDKSALSQSIYTIPEAEKLLVNKKGESYYWRVRATDGLANTGGWSTGAAFSVAAPPAKVSNILLYVGIALGGVALFIVGFWIGRRTSYAA